MTNTIPNVPRELLERVLNAGWGSETVNALDDLRDFLESAPSPAGVDGLKVVGYVSQDDIKWQGDCTLRLKPYSDYVIPLCHLSDAQAIIDGLRGENERIRLNIAEYNEAISCYQSERDQQAQRIGELEGLLRHAQKQVPTGSGLHMRIDAALSAVCAAAPNIATTSEHSSQPERDPCPMCIKGGICNTPTCGRLLAMPKAY